MTPSAWQATWNSTVPSGPVVSGLALATCHSGPLVRVTLTPTSGRARTTPSGPDGRGGDLHHQVGRLVDHRCAGAMAAATLGPVNGVS